MQPVSYVFLITRSGLTCLSLAVEKPVIGSAYMCDKLWGRFPLHWSTYLSQF